MLFYLKIYVS